MSLREGRLIRRLRSRDEKAFRELIETYRDRVYNLSFRMVGNREEAEDLAQEVFITVFKSIETFRGDSKFSTWLYRITANHCKNRIKYLARRYDRKQAEYDDEQEREPDSTGVSGNPAPRPDARLEGQQLEALLQEAIAELDEEQRILVILRDIEELSMEEIAEVTDIPIGTVKSRLHRARLQLRKKLTRHI